MVYFFKHPSLYSERKDCNMKNVLLVFIFLLAPFLSMYAQNKGETINKGITDKGVVLSRPDSSFYRPAITDTAFSDGVTFNDYALPSRSEFLQPYAHTDSLNLPSIDRFGRVVPSLMCPLYWGGWYDWGLHKGLNVSLGASVFAQFGKGAYGGAGFNQNISAMYAMPLTNRLSLAVGGYFNNTYWAHDSYRDAGLYAIIGYKFNDKWEGYVFGQKSIVDKRMMPMPLYDINAVGDRIGAAIKYNINPSMSIQVTVENTWLPTPGVPRVPLTDSSFSRP